jgi:sulfatase maturation enzyme AslB (radical SAM superfamily)
MKLASLPRKIARGLPYLGKELRAIASDNTPFFVAVPRTVHIWRGGPCNAKCIMCNYGWSKGEDLKALFRTEMPDDEMPRVIREIHELCGRGTLVSYMTGEPTLNKGIVEWVRLASSLGVDFRFTTNGYTMTPELARQFVEAGIFNIGVSLEALDPTINETLRPYTGGTERTVNAIEYLIAERQRQNRKVSVNIKTVLTDINLAEFIKIVRRWGKTDGVMCTPQMFEPMIGMPPSIKDTCYIRDISKLEAVVAEIRKLKAEGYAIHATDAALDEFVKLYRDDTNKTSTMSGEKMDMDPSAPVCNIGTDNLWIHESHVKLCPYHSPIGNVVKDKGRLTLKQMWEGEITRQIREQTRACRRLCNISCLRRTPITHKVKMFFQLA